jgi:glucokinase
MNNPLSIGVDLGGTKILAGVVDGAGTILEIQRVPTSGQNGVEVVAEIVQIIKDFSSRYSISSAGLAIAGFLSPDRKFIGINPNIKQLENFPIYQSLVAKTDLEIFIENDANAAAWGEYRFGAGIGANPMAMMTVGTGIGGGLIIDGKLVIGASGKAGEFGHLPVVDQGELCGCGARGCLERYGSGSALIRSLERIVKERGLTADRWSDQIDGSEITEAALSGDQDALFAFDEIGKWLAVGIKAVSAMIDPEKIIIGGGVSEAGDLLLRPILRQLESNNQQLEHEFALPEIVMGRLGNSAGLIGVSDLARKR